MRGIAGLINKYALPDIVKGSAATLALFLAYIMLMLAGPLFGIFSPFPVLFYTVKSGRGVGVASVVVVTFVLVVVSPAGALFYFFQCGLFSLLLSGFLARGNGVARTIASTVAINLLVIMVFAASFGLWQGINPDSLVQKEIRDAVVQTEAYYLEHGIAAGDIESLKQGLKSAAELVGKTYPALFVVCLGAIAGLNLMLLKRFSHLLPQQLNFGEFSRFRNPEKLIWVMIVSGFALLVHEDMVTRAALNILVVTLSLYFVQGLSIVAHFFTRFRLPRFVKLILYVLLVVQPYLMIVVVLIGLFDLWCDFRTPKKQENL
jgi:uncharacterized protein YybS (DUF2232 family)